jgi:hypothetical protein
MPFPLSFRDRQSYELRGDKPSVRTKLIFGDLFTDCVAYIDTGATVCLFQRELSDTLHINVEAGRHAVLGTLTGRLIAYGHELRLQVGALSFQTTVYFAAEYGLPRNLLGKFGFLQQTKFGLVDYDEMIYLSHYNDPA